jgi:hypothetical protein
MKALTRGGPELARERPGTIALAVLAAGAVLVGIALSDSASAGARWVHGEADKETIASETSNGLRVRLVAHREGTGPSPTATVRIAAFERSHGSWDRLGRARLVGKKRAWFWEVVTHRYGVHQLAIRLPGGMFPLQVRLRLLESASLGPSEPFFFTVDHGRLVPIYP